MKNLINYFYDFNISDLRNLNDSYIFNFNNRTYIFNKIEYDFDSKSFIEILKTLHFIPQLHTIILNRNNELITGDENNYYIMLKVNIDYNTSIDFDNIISLCNYYTNLKSYQSSGFEWITLWSKKIDYLEFYMGNKDNISDEIKCIFNYYIGMGENAINYIKNAVNEFRVTDKDGLGLCHKRIRTEYTLYELYNPLNIVIDHKTRDIAEYLKACFVSANYDHRFINEIILKLDLSEFGYNILIGRLLFPTFFFDMMDEYENKSVSVNQVLEIYNRTSEYEKFLNTIFLLIKKNKNINLVNVLWLNQSN